MRKLVFPLLIALFVLGGCKKDIQNTDAVRQGVINYFSKRPDLSKMDVTVTNVAFRQDEADATVHIQAKDSTAPGTGIDMRYVLERKGNEWVVKKPMARHSGTAGTPDNPHGTGAMPSMPGGSPGTLPPGHPPLPPQGTKTAPPPSGQPK